MHRPPRPSGTAVASTGFSCAGATRILVRTIHLTRQQLEGRLDSLQREFEGLGLDAPDRIELSRELRTLISSLANLSQVEQNVRARVSSSLAENGGLRKRVLIGAAPVFAGQLRSSAISLQPGWIGLNVEAPHSRMVVRDDSAYIRYFGYPDVISVEPNSPAERAGIMPGRSAHRVRWCRPA